MSLRHAINIGVVEIAIEVSIKGMVSGAVGQFFLKLGKRLLSAMFVVIDEILNLFALDRDVIDVEKSVFDLNAVARQTNDTLNIIGLVVARQLEHRDITAFRNPVMKGIYVYVKIINSRREKINSLYLFTFYYYH